MRDMTRPQRFFPPASTYLHTEEDWRNARDGYRLFFEAFTDPDPANYLSFDAFAYKHYAAPTRPSTNQVFAYKDGRPVATEWYLDLPTIHDGRTYACVHGGDVCATEEGRGLPFLKMHAAGERLLKSLSYELRVSAPNANSMKFIERFGGQVLGDHRIATAGAERMRTRCAELAASGVASQISFHDACPFVEDDYQRMNAAALPIRSLRNAAYFAYRVDGLVERRFTYVLARRESVPVGYLILRWDARGRATLFDWDLLTDDVADRQAVLADMLLGASPLMESLDVPQLCEESGEVALFERCGFELLRDHEGSPLGDKFVVTAYDSDLDPAFFEIGSWRQRLIDKDYGLNATRGY